MSQAVQALPSMGTIIFHRDFPGKPSEPDVINPKVKRTLGMR
jgi:hypothetical protein